MNNQMVINYKDEAFTNSLIIAQGTGVEHSSVIRLATNYKTELEEFGRVGFQIVPLETKGGIQKVKICRLNEEQATFLISLMKNTKPVVQFKKALVKEFYSMKKFIATLVTTRKDFPLLTDNIKLLHESPKPYHFSNECDMINKLVTGMTAKKFREVHNIPKGESIRPYLTDEQIALMEKLQKADVGLLIAFPNYEDRKRHLEWYMMQLQKSVA